MVRFPGYLLLNMAFLSYVRYINPNHLEAYLVWVQISSFATSRHAVMESITKHLASSASRPGPCEWASFVLQCTASVIGASSLRHSSWLLHSDCRVLSGFFFRFTNKQCGNNNNRKEQKSVCFHFGCRRNIPESLSWHGKQSLSVTSAYIRGLLYLQNFKLIAPKGKKLCEI